MFDSAHVSLIKKLEVSVKLGLSLVGHRRQCKLQGGNLTWTWSRWRRVNVGFLRFVTQFAVWDVCRIHPYDMPQQQLYQATLDVMRYFSCVQRNHKVVYFSMESGVHSKWMNERRCRVRVEVDIDLTDLTAVRPCRRAHGSQAGGDCSARTCFTLHCGSASNRAARGRLKSNTSLKRA